MKLVSAACGPAGLLIPAALVPAVLMLAGCASPGPPLPPSLKLPQIVKDLAAMRVGDQVRLTWTTPARTTDRLPISGAIMAEICRDVPGVAAGRSQQVVSPVQSAPGVPCTAVAHVTVRPGASQAVDTLPAGLAAGAPRLLAYRVQLRNAAGQTAGPSEAVFAASGLAPAEVEGLRATAGKAGAMLEWRAGSSALAASSGGTESVEVSRVRVDGPANPTGAAKSKSSAGVMGTAKDSANAQFRVSWSADLSGASSDSARHGDPGGAVDRSAKTGEMYRYTVERVWTFELGGHTLELRSRVSPPQTVAMLDIFAPDAPAGLVTSPAYAGGGEAGKTRKPAIDLSWEPGTEARIAGYIVFRRDLDGSAPDAVRRVNPELAVMPSYRDATVEGGKRYAYRVSAVDGAGNVSAPGNEVVESAPGQ